MTDFFYLPFVFKLGYANSEDIERYLNPFVESYNFNTPKSFKWISIEGLAKMNIKEEYKFGEYLEDVSVEFTSGDFEIPHEHIVLFAQSANGELYMIGRYGLPAISISKENNFSSPGSDVTVSKFTAKIKSIHAIHKVILS